MWPIGSGLGYSFRVEKQRIYLGIITVEKQEQVTENKKLKILQEKLSLATYLEKSLAGFQGSVQRVEKLFSLIKTQELGNFSAIAPSLTLDLHPDQQSVLLQLLFCKQLPQNFFEFSLQKISTFLEPFVEAEIYYRSIGGLCGYYKNFISLLCNTEKKDHNRKFLSPVGVDFAKNREEKIHFSDWALEHLDCMAEMWPVGGAGDRLNLQDEKTGQSLPAGFLPFDGYTLLERLFRSVKSREYAYFCKTGKNIVIPVALMTSKEKNNTALIQQACQRANWFGRPKESIRFFEQPLVPVISETADFMIDQNGQAFVKPGGHGVLWKLAADQGVLDWFVQKGKTKLLIQQINNPIAGVDAGLLSFIGVGIKGDYDFGFCSCHRVVGASEGMNVVVEKNNQYNLTNIEYTDLKDCGIEDQPAESGSNFSQFPCNTNILFADIAFIQQQAECNPVPGMLINMKSSMVIDGKKVHYGRLEATMQNIADDQWTDRDSLRSYITFDDRKKTISATKQLAESEKTLVGTPEGAYFDLLQNAKELLDICGMKTPDLATEQQYREEGPCWMFRYNPCLGTTYETIAKKIQGGCLHEKAELELEIINVEMVDVELLGSLLIQAENLLEGSVSLCRVEVRNKGAAVIKGEKGVPPPYWRSVERLEAVEIVVEGSGRFEAVDVVFLSSEKIVVPDGYLLQARTEGDTVVFEKTKL